jgi:hypothetical protein
MPNAIYLQKLAAPVAMSRLEANISIKIIRHYGMTCSSSSSKTQWIETGSQCARTDASWDRSLLACPNACIHLMALAVG